jgi:hypothetical protein
MLLKGKGLSRWAVGGEEREPEIRIQQEQDQVTGARGCGKFGFRILDCPPPLTCCLLPAAYRLLLTPYCLFGILGAAEVMRVFQPAFFDASQKHDELSALASCWL